MSTAPRVDQAYLNRLFALEGKTAIVTGATSGIGEMIATAFVHAGARTYVNSRKADACEKVAKALSAFGDCRPLPGDVGSRDGCLKIADAFRSQESKLHVLVNAAGATWGAPIESYPDAGWDKVLAINVRGPFNLSVALLPELRADGTADDPSRIINIGSVHAEVAPPWDSYAYSASKAGVHHLTRHLAKRLGREHIVVNAIAPGPFPSRMMAQTIAEQGDELVKETATGRLGIADDMAGIAIYLASRAASNVTGAIIPVCGGYGTLR
jgi:NAD(P)-dependent dehydrogenase (short-subunit alcohol dehydrogenase family)